MSTTDAMSSPTGGGSEMLETAYVYFLENFHKIYTAEHTRSINGSRGGLLTPYTHFECNF